MVDIVDVDTDAGLERKIKVVLSDAANVGGHRVAEGRLGWPQHGVRHRVTELIRLGERSLREIRPCDRGNRDGGLLQELFAVSRGDDDLFQGAGCGTGNLRLLLLRQCGGRAEQQQRTRECQDRG